MDGHEAWERQIEAELDGELSLTGRAALARHLVSCPHCAGARASHLELRAAIASSAGDPHARVMPRRAPIQRRTLFWTGSALLVVGAALGWAMHARWGGPGGDLEASRAAIIAR